METFGVMVGFSDRRPIVPDEGHRFVVVAARHGREAELVAAQDRGRGRGNGDLHPDYVG